MLRAVGTSCCVSSADRQVEEADSGERERDGAEGRHVLELRRHDEGRDRVADRHDEELSDGEETHRSPGRQAGTADDDRDAGESDDEPESAGGAKDAPVSAREGDHGREERDGRDQKAGEAGRKRLLGMAE